MHTTHENSNENGRILGQFATKNNMLITSTVYPHKRIHLGIWKIAGTNEVNQTDHVLVSKRHSSSIKDVRSCRGPNCDSEHCLVKVQVQEKLANIQKMAKITRKKWGTDKLIKQPEVREEYESKLQMRLQDCDTEGSEDVDRTWNAMERIIKGVANEVIGEKKIKRNEEWFDGECVKCITEKNKARERMIQREARTNYENYQEKRRQAYRICRRKKKEMIQKQVEELEKFNKPNERRKFHKAVDQQKRGFQPKLTGCKSKGGRKLGEEKEVLDRWTEYFEELLNAGKGNEDPEIVRRDNGPGVDDGQCEPPTYEEAGRNIQKLKNNKALGEVNITAELIKYGGKAVREAVHKLITLIWETEQIPDNWRTGIICPIFKKGDKLNCNNYRGITLFNIVYQVQSSLISEKLKTTAESIIGEY
jgi:hypothetical protein